MDFFYKSKSKTRSKSKSKSKTRSKSKSKSKSKSLVPGIVPIPSHIPASLNLHGDDAEPQKSKSSSSVTSNYQDAKLKMPIPISDKINYSSTVAKKMDKIFQSYENVEPFTSSFYLANLFYLYLFKKYKMECSLKNQEDREVMSFTLDVSNHSKEPWYKSFEEFQTDTIKSTAKYISRCIISGSKIIIIPLSIITSYGGHANLLIYRQNTGEIEHFEPHGSKYSGKGHSFIVPKLNSYFVLFVKLLNKYIKADNKTHEGNQEKLPKITLIKAHDVCPIIHGVQALEGASTIPKNALIEPEGYCETWSMFFTELCLKNPEISSRDIYEAIMEKTELYDNKNDYLRNIIRGYTSFINNKIAKHFSRVFDEPITSAKAHNFSLRNKTDAEAKIYYEKLLEIMEVETGYTFFTKTQNYPDVKARYNDFTQGINPETSSSSLKNERRVASPKRMSASALAKTKASASATATAKTRKTSPKNEEENLDKINKAKMNELLKNASRNHKIKQQQEKDEKAAAKKLVKEEKEREKEEKSKAKTAKAKTTKLDDMEHLHV